MTRIQQVRGALERARTEEGDHWETGELELDLETATGDDITVTVGLNRTAPESAQQRYGRAKELEQELERQRAVLRQLTPLPADPVA